MTKRSQKQKVILGAGHYMPDTGHRLFPKIGSDKK